MSGTMPKFNAAMGIAIIALAALLSGEAIGKGGHGGGRGHGGHARGHGHGHGHGHFGRGHGHHGGKFAIHRSYSRGHFRGHRAFAVRNAGPRNYRNAMNSLSRGGGLRNGRLLGNPVARSQIAAGLAVAGWQGGRAASGWWQHAGGGYGWVGPLFWPFAYHDIYDYTIWGDGIGFWDYGYTDIYAGIFGPYGYDDLTRYVAQRPSGRRHRGPAPLAQMCGDDSRAIVGLPINQILAAVQPNEAQYAALDELGNASIAAAQTIRAGCPAQIVLTATGRLAAMEQRLQAMTSAVAVMQPPLVKFYGMLDDEQKARFNALAADQRKMASANNAEAAPAPGCAAALPAALAWPAAEIEARLQPNDTQRATLQVLQDTSAEAAETLKAACQPGEVMTPPARFAAIARRLDAMLQAVKQVRAALEDFYATLNDEQKAQFEAIGPRRAA